MTTTEVIPAEMGGWLHAERNGGKQGNRWHLALVVTNPGVAGGYLAIGNRLQNIERRYQLAGLVDPNLDAAIGSGIEVVGDPGSR